MNIHTDRATHTNRQTHRNTHTRTHTQKHTHTKRHLTQTNSEGTTQRQWAWVMSLCLPRTSQRVLMIWHPWTTATTVLSWRKRSKGLQIKKEKVYCKGNFVSSPAFCCQQNVSNADPTVTLSEAQGVMGVENPNSSWVSDWPWSNVIFSKNVTRSSSFSSAWENSFTILTTFLKKITLDQGQLCFQTQRALTLRKAWNLGRSLSHLVIVSLIMSK